MMRAVSRVVGVHRLILLNFYPFLQKYIRPHQHDVTHILAALIQVRPSAAGSCGSPATHVDFAIIIHFLAHNLCQAKDVLSERVRERSQVG